MLKKKKIFFSFLYSKLCPRSHSGLGTGTNFSVTAGQTVWPSPGSSCSLLWADRALWQWRKTVKTEPEHWGHQVAPAHTPGCQAEAEGLQEDEGSCSLDPSQSLLNPFNTCSPR